MFIESHDKGGLLLEIHLAPGSSRRERRPSWTSCVCTCSIYVSISLCLSLSLSLSHSLCIYIYIHMCVYIYIYIHTHMYVCVYIYIYIYIYVFGDAGAPGEQHRSFSEWCRDRRVVRGLYAGDPERRYGAPESKLHPAQTPRDPFRTFAGSQKLERKCAEFWRCLGTDLSNHKERYVTWSLRTSWCFVTDSCPSGSLRAGSPRRTLALKAWRLSVAERACPGVHTPFRGWRTKRTSGDGMVLILDLAPRVQKKGCRDLPACDAAPAVLPRLCLGVARCCLYYAYVLYIHTCIYIYIYIY